MTLSFHSKCFFYDYYYLKFLPVLFLEKAKLISFHSLSCQYFHPFLCIVELPAASQIRQYSLENSEPLSPAVFFFSFSRNHC